MYDELNPKQEELYSSLLNSLRMCPDRLAKKVLSEIFERFAITHLNLNKENIKIMEGDDYIAENWEEIEEIRDNLALEFHHSLNRHEF